MTSVPKLMHRVGLGVLVVGVLTAVVGIAVWIGPTGRSLNLSRRNFSPSNWVGEAHYQLWKRHVAPAGSIDREIDFRLRRDWTESSLPVGVPVSQRRVAPLLFDVPPAEAALDELP